jgi:purine nucleoside phosphorylase
MLGSWCDSCESAVAIKSLFSCRAMALATKYPPHQINYRANIAALLDLGVTEIVAVNAVIAEIVQHS